MRSILDQFNWKSDEDEVLYDSDCMRRQVIHHVVDNIVIFKDWLTTEVKNAYGSRKDGDPIGPFSVKSYLHYLLEPGNWADAIFICLVCSMWGLRATVVRSDSCAPMTFRHEDRNLKQVDLVLLFNCDMYTGHYSSVQSTDNTNVAVRQVEKALGFDDAVDDEERNPKPKPTPKPKGTKPKGGRKPKGGKKPKATRKDDDKEDDDDDNDGDDDGDDDGDEDEDDDDDDDPDYKPKKVKVDRDEWEAMKRQSKLLVEFMKAVEGKKNRFEGISYDRDRKREDEARKESSSEAEIIEDIEVVEKGSEETVCMHCNTECKTTANLKKHLKKFHADKTPYRCDVCNKGLQSLEGYRRHLMVHKKKEDRIQCPKCDKDVGSKPALKLHMKEQHPPTPPPDEDNDDTPKEKEFKCQYCKKYGTDIQRLYTQHLYGCKGKGNPHKRNLKCEVCGKTGFPTQSQVMQHKKRNHNWKKST